MVFWWQWIGVAIYALGWLGSGLYVNRRGRKPATQVLARWGDTSDEMFEAMREVDAMGLSGEPLLASRLPPRGMSVGEFMKVNCPPEQIALMFPPPPSGLTPLERRHFDQIGMKIQRKAKDEGFEIEFDPMTGRTRSIR